MDHNSKTHRRFGIKPFGKRFEGYAFTDSSNGKSRYTYIGEYYSRKLDEKKCFWRHCMYCILSSLGIAVFFVVGLASSEINRSGFMALISSLSFLSYLWMIYIIIVMAFNKNHLTIWAFRVSAIQFLLCSAVCAILALLGFVFTLIFLIVQGTITPSVDITGCVFRLVAALLFAVNVFVEFNTEYDVDYPS